METILAITVLVVCLAALSIAIMSMTGDDERLISRIPWGVRMALAVTSIAGLLTLAAAVD